MSRMHRSVWAFTMSALLLTTAMLAEAQPAKTARTTTGIAYDIRGSGPAVVLITGSNLDRRMWEYEARWLARDHTVIRYDLRAHGASDTATRPFRHLDDLFTLLDEIGVKKATVIGVSAGAAIALDAALADPSRFERLVLAGPGVSGFVSKAQVPFTGAVIEALRARDYARAGEILLETSVFEVEGPSRALVRQMVMSNDRLWSIPREMVLPVDRPAVDRLEELKLPTLVLVGERDVVQREHAELLARRVAAATLVIIPRGGHLLNLTSPAEFKTAVAAFLTPRKY
jgi:3-oxoadipate enol-lactonase